MSYAVCIVPVAAIRLRADHRDEMVSQVLFGESLKVSEIDRRGWATVESLQDGYQGYCRINQFVVLQQPIVEMNEYSGDWVEEIMVNDQKLMIPFGSNLSILSANIPGYKIAFSGNIYNASNAVISPGSIADISAMFLNTAYLWGGKSVFGIDCSGFVQAVFKMLNISLPRDANQQAIRGEAIGFLQEVVCGDLAFFDDINGEIIHVGILLNDHEIIHASGMVRVDAIDNEGIIHSSTKKRTHRLRTIKRVISGVR
ncbi:MAG: C40 family peptidase [Gloeobacteraceae cyanobacterium ES-bin-316]|nr:C40 family peptidase [Ferruginibacter sp.]